jgi:DDE domain
LTASLQLVGRALSDEFWAAVRCDSLGHDQPVPIFQQLARGHPSGRDDVREIPLSLRNVEDLPAERGIDISYETVRFWWNRFGPMFAAEIRKKRVAHMRGYTQWRWHVDEVFVKVNGALRYLWRAVDHEGEVLEAVVTAKRDKAAALKLLKRIMKDTVRRRASSPTGFGLILRRWMRSGLPIDTRSVVTSIIERRTRTSHFDDESERC